MTIWYILWPTGIFWGHMVPTFWGNLVHFSTFLYVVRRKIWQTRFTTALCRQSHKGWLKMVRVGYTKYIDTRGSFESQGMHMNACKRHLSNFEAEADFFRMKLKVSCKFCLHAKLNLVMYF
jgi:hypothetical protein